MYKRGGRGEDEREGEDVGLWCRIYMSTGVHVVEIRYGLRKNQFGRFVLWGFALGRAGQLAAGPCLAVRGGARVAAVGGGGGTRGGKTLDKAKLLYAASGYQGDTVHREGISCLFQE